MTFGAVLKLWFGLEFKLLHGQFLNFLFVYLFISFLYWVYGHPYLQIFDTIFDCNATFELYVNDVIQCIPMSDSKLFVKIFILIMHFILVNNMMMRDITQVTYLHGCHSFNTKVTLLITNRNGGKSKRPPFSF